MRLFLPYIDRFTFNILYDIIMLVENKHGRAKAAKTTLFCLFLRPQPGAKEQQMKERDAFSFRRGDCIVIALVVLLAFAVAIAYLPEESSAQNAAVQVYQDSVLVRELPLNADAAFKVEGEYVNSIVIRDGRACIESSDCPGGDCVHSGWISQSGRSIVCLPNRVEIRISGLSDVDFVVG